MSFMIDKISVLLLLLLSGDFLVPSCSKLQDSMPLPSWFSATKKQTNKTKLTISTVFNYGGYIIPIGAIGTVQIQVALDSAQRAGILSDYDVSIRAYDDMCDHGAGVPLIMNLLNSASDPHNDQLNLMPLTLGPFCAYQAYTANVMKHYNFAMVTNVGDVREMFYDRVYYEAFYALNPSIEIWYDAVPPFLASNGWTRVFLLTETYAFWGPFEDKMIANMASLNITLAGVSKVVTLPGELPAPELFDVAIRELASHDPRIIVINSDFGALVACWLYRYNLYGPQYVFILVSVALFLPNSQPRAENCTDQMLFEVMQSAIVFTFGFPLDLNPDVRDITGTSGQYLVDKMMDAVDRPNLAEKWYFWRCQCYDQIIGGLLALDAVDKELKKSNDSLSNWATTSDNFQRNGSHFYALLKQKVKNLSYKGICSTTDRVGVNAVQGVTAFHQPQLIENSEIAVTDLTASVKMVVVATYDSSSSNHVVLKTSGSYNWRTHDAQPPHDSRRILTVKDPLVDAQRRAPLLTYAVLLIATNLAIFCVNLKKRNTMNVSNSLPFVNSAILVGNSLVICFVLIMPSEILPSDSSKCMTASLSLIVGFSLLSAALLAKMEIAAAICSRGVSHHQTVITRLTVSGMPRSQHPARRPSQESISSIRLQQLPTPRRSTRSMSITFSTSQTDELRMVVSNSRITVTPESLKRAIWYGFVFMLVWALCQTLIAASWFGDEPLVVVKFDRQSVSIDELSVTYQHISNACRIKPGSEIAYGFIGLLISCYGVLTFRSMYLAFVLRSRQIGCINDLLAIRIVSYATSLLVFTGAAVLWSFFNKDPGVLQTAIFILVLLVATVVTSVIFGPKIRRGVFL